MTQLSTTHPYGLLALQFAQALAGQRFEEAYQLLSAASRATLSLADMREAFLHMIAYGDGPADVCEVMIVDDSAPQQTPHDLAWVYVAICGPEFSEAVSLTVVDDAGQFRLRIGEWGRP